MRTLENAGAQGRSVFGGRRLLGMDSGHRQLLTLGALALVAGSLAGIHPVLAVPVVLGVVGFVAREVDGIAWITHNWGVVILHLLVLSVFVESVTIAGITVGRLLSLVCLAAIGLRVMVGGRRVSEAALLWCLPVFIFAAWYAVSGLWADRLGDWLFSIGQIALAVLYFGAVLVLTPQHEPHRVVRGLLRTYVAGAMCAGLFGLVQVIWTDRAVGLQGDPNIYAMYQVASIPAAIALMRGSRARWVYVIAVAVALVSVLASGSRGGIIATGATLLLSAIVMAPRHRRTQLFGVGLIGVAALAGASFLTNTRAARVSTDRASGRIDIWHVAWAEFMEHPVLGIGSGQFKGESIDLLVTTPGVELLRSHLLVGKGIEVHNLYLEALAERGLIGLLFLLVLLCSTLTLLLRMGDDRFPETLALAPMLVAFAVATFFLSIANNKLFWILIGLSIVLQARSGRAPAHADAAPAYAEQHAEGHL